MTLQSLSDRLQDNPDDWDVRFVIPAVSSREEDLLPTSNQRLIITINTTAEVRPMFLVVMMYGILSRVQTTNHITKGLLRLFVIPADLGANLSMELRAVGVMLL